MIISRETVFTAFDKDAAPACTVQAPCHLTFQTRDALNGRVTSEDQPVETLNFRGINPATGPVYIEGAEPGDALRVSIRAIRLADSGVALTIPGTGVLPDKVGGRIAICPVGEKTFIFRGVELPLSPMIGVIGVAPAGKPIGCAKPGTHGGNMDTTGIGPGALLILPVQVPGALFGLGDLHAAMGDGEVCVTGIEIPGEVDVRLDVEKGLNLLWPLLKTQNELAFLASAPTTDEALRLSVDAMNALLVRETSLDCEDALILMSLCGSARICQVVDPLMTARFCMPLDVLQKFGVAMAF